MKRMKEYSFHGRTYTGKTLAEAKSAAAEALADTMSLLDAGVFVATVYGPAGPACVMVCPMRDGLATHVLTTPEHALPSGILRNSSIAMPSVTTDAAKLYDSEIESAIRHAAHLAWSHDADDSAWAAGAAKLGNTERMRASLADDLARWARFQRAYKDNIQSGMSPAAAHDAACRA